MINERMVQMLAASIILGGLLSGGIYTAAGSQNGGLVVNRFTGTTWSCSLGDCYRFQGERVRGQ